MKLKLKKGTTSKKLKIFVGDSSSTTGAGLSGLLFNTASLTWYYIREGDAAATAVTPQTATLGTWTTRGFIAVGSMAGVYEIGVPDAALSSGADSVHMMLSGAANMVPVLIEIELDSVDYQDSVRLGLSSLPNAAANANGGLPILSSAGTTLNYTIATLFGHTAQTGDSFVRIGALGASLTALAPSSTALSNVTWTATKAGYLDQAISAAKTLTTGTLDSIENRILDADLGTNHQGDGSLGSYLNEIQATVDGRLPAALVSGRMDSSVGAIATGAIVTGSFAAGTTLPIVTTLTNLPSAPADWLTASAVKADAVTKIQLGLSTYSGADTAGTTLLLTRVTGAVALSATALSNATWTDAKAAFLNAAVDSRMATFTYTAPTTPPTASAIAIAVVDQALAGHTAPGSVGAALVAAGGAGDPWSVTVTTLQGYAASTAGGLLLKLLVGEPTAPVIVIPAPSSDPTLCAVYAYLETLQNVPAVNVSIKFTLHAPSPVKSNKLLVISEVTVTTNADGRLVDSNSNLYVLLQRNDMLTPAGSFYRVTCSALKLWNKAFTLSSDTFNLATLVA